MEFIPVYQPSLAGNEKKYVNDCIDSGWISGKGKYVSEFENSFAKYIGIRHATSVCNGTIALHLALLALGVGPGDEVIVPTFTYIASVNAILYVGAKPVFVDSCPDSWQIDPAEVKRKITSNTKAIMAVHLYGHPCDMGTLIAIAKEHRVFLVEDCAEALGSLFRGRHVATFGDIAAFSFYGNKTITTGEGGMVVTNDSLLHERACHFKGQGLAKYREYWHDQVGYNFRMTNVSAAIGLAQLERADELIAKKLEIAKEYDECLKRTVFQTHKPVGDVCHSYWMYSVLVPEMEVRDQVRDHLRKANIETRPTFYPVHTMPMYAAKFERHQVAENIALRGINLPSYPGLTKEQIKYITDTIKQSL